MKHVYWLQMQCKDRVGEASYYPHSPFRPEFHAAFEGFVIRMDVQDDGARRVETVETMQRSTLDAGRLDTQVWMARHLTTALRMDLEIRWNEHVSVVGLTAHFMNYLCRLQNLEYGVAMAKGGASGIHLANHYVRWMEMTDVACFPSDVVSCEERLLFSPAQVLEASAMIPPEALPQYAITDPLRAEKICLHTMFR